MNNPKLYSVKEAAKIIGVSTNTLYKYLEDGRIHAARGSALQGRFRIPESALEEFLGVSLGAPEPLAISTPLSTSLDTPTSPLAVKKDGQSPKLPTKITRFLLLLALLALLVDLFISDTISLASASLRLLLLMTILLLAYQDGGYRKDKKVV